MHKTARVGFAALRRHGTPLSDNTVELYRDAREQQRPKARARWRARHGPRLLRPHPDSALHSAATLISRRSWDAALQLAASCTRAGSYARAAQDTEEDAEGLGPSALMSLRPSGSAVTSREALPVAAAVVQLGEKFSAKEMIATSAIIPSDASNSGLSVGLR